MTPAFTRKLLAGLLAGPKAAKPRAARSRLKVCVFKLDGIGDFVLALGAIRRILDRHGEDQCALVLSAPAAELARREFPKAVVFGFPYYTGGAKSILALRFGQAVPLRDFSFETLISLRYQRTTLHHLVLSWINAGHSVGFANSPALAEADRTIFQFPLSEMLPLPMQAPAGVCLELERHRTLVQHLLKQETPMAGILPHFTSFAPRAGIELVVTPCSSLAVKDYPDDKLLAVLKEVSRAVDAPIRFCGSPAEQARLDRLGTLLRSQGVAHVSVETPHSVADFAQRVAQAKAILTVDTSTAHLATTFDKPAVILIGGGAYGEFGPWQRSAKQRWLTNQLPCFGCHWRCIYPEVRCLTEISPSEVASVVVGAWRNAK